MDDIRTTFKLAGDRKKILGIDHDLLSYRFFLWAVHLNFLVLSLAQAKRIEKHLILQSDDHADRPSRT